MKARTIFFAFFTLLFFTSTAYAKLCSEYGSADCPADGNCWLKASLIFGILECTACTPEFRCSDYNTEDSCQRDWCDVLENTNCVWDTVGINECLSPCETMGVDDSTYSSANFRTCTAADCYYGGWWDWHCTECEYPFECSDYKRIASGQPDADIQYQCEDDPCGAPGICAWDDNEEECVVDSDGDGVVGDRDNCPLISNRDQNNTYCAKSPDRMVDGDGNCRSDPGDACDDTDDDGILDGEELAYGTSPLDTDSDDNCVNDGVENMMNPIISILTNMAIAAATVMLLYMAMRWLTADDEKTRANSKAGVVYIMIGLIMLIGGKNLVIFILQLKCTGETPAIPTDGSAGVWLCPAACDGAISLLSTLIHQVHQMSAPILGVQHIKYESNNGLPQTPGGGLK